MGMTIRVKIYIDGDLKRVFTDDIGEDQCINLCNTLVREIHADEFKSGRGSWSTEVRWEVEVLR